MCRTMNVCDSGLLNSSYNEKCFGQNLYRKSKHTNNVQYLFSEKCALYVVRW